MRPRHYHQVFMLREISWQSLQIWKRCLAPGIPMQALWLNPPEIRTHVLNHFWNCQGCICRCCSSLGSTPACSCMLNTLETMLPSQHFQDLQNAAEWAVDSCPLCPSAFPSNHKRGKMLLRRACLGPIIIPRAVGWLCLHGFMTHRRTIHRILQMWRHNPHEAHLL